MAVKPEARKRPCDQCRASYNFEYQRGEYLRWETPEGIEFRNWSNCCGEWVILFPAATNKLTYRRPFRHERIGA
jgi:hypothetical protein